MIRRWPIYITSLALVAVLIGFLTKEAYLQEDRNKRKDVSYNAFAHILDPRLQAPNFSLKDLNGNQVTLKDTRGKVVMINFRATW